jgi:hypothetical protein
MADGLYQLTLPHLCAGLVVAGGRVTRAAPILRWTIGKPAKQVWLWAQTKGGTCVRVGD